MRYFLNLRQGDDVQSDLEGSEHPHLDGARLEAVDAARQMMAQATLSGWDVSDRCFEIIDEDGAILTRVPFGATIRRSMLIGEVGASIGGGDCFPRPVASAGRF